jgi:hypothetical protein
MLASMLAGESLAVRSKKTRIFNIRVFVLPD